jgi:hypothetical protein
MNRPLKLLAIVVAIVSVLGLASYVMTFRHWDGGFPSGEFHLDVRDPLGMPVQAAVLRVYRAGTEELAFDYPLDNHVATRELASDKSGRITAIRKHGGLQFGGHEWDLFWIIRIGEGKVPKYNCEITAAGFKPLKFGLGRLFESPHQSYSDFPKTKLTVHGEEIEVPIYEHIFTLER